jgi:hypothetical protein
MLSNTSRRSSGGRELQNVADLRALSQPAIGQSGAMLHNQPPDIMHTCTRIEKNHLLFSNLQLVFAWIIFNAIVRLERLSDVSKFLG